MSEPAKKKRKARAKKDPNKPKNARSAYIIFCQMQREMVKAENPEFTSSDIMKHMGSIWRELDDDAKAKYNELAAQDKQRFDNDMADYVPGAGYDEQGVSKAAPKQKKGKRDPKAPKMPRSAYILFCQEKRGEVKDANPDMSPSEIMKHLGQLWRELDEDSKEEYTKASAEDKERYNEELKGYVPSSDYNAKGGRTSAAATTTTGKKRKRKDPNEPKRALSAYLFFGNDKRAEIKAAHPEATSPEIMKLLGEAWRAMTDEEKAPYNEKAQQDRARYEKARESYERTRTHTEEVAQESSDDSESSGGDDSSDSSSSDSE